MGLDRAKIHLDLYKFITTGEFGSLVIGQHIDEVKKIFPTPDSVHDMDYNILWHFGWFELHFFENTLYQIWSDDLEYMKSSTDIKVEKWIFQNINSLTYRKVLSIFDKEMIGVTSVHREDREYTEVTVDRSHVMLHFEKGEKPCRSIDDYKLRALLLGMSTIPE